MKKALIVIFLSLCIQGCFDNFGELPLDVQNNSMHSISVFNNKSENHKAIYPDTTITMVEGRTIYISQGKKEDIAGSRNWKSTFEVNYPNDTMSIIILHADTLDKYSWSEIRSDYNILARYDLSFRDLERLDWTLTYPPDQRMQGVQMFLPE